MSEEETSWTVVYETGTDYESELVRDRLDDAGIPAVIDSKRDHAIPLNIGSLSTIYIRVPTKRAGEARALLATPPLSNAELSAAAMSADPHADVDIDIEFDDESEAGEA